MKVRKTVFWMALACAGVSVLVPALVPSASAQPQQSEDDSAALVREGREALRARSIFVRIQGGEYKRFALRTRAAEFGWLHVPSSTL